MCSRNTLHCFQRFCLISLESGDLQGFYCRASRDKNHIKRHDSYKKCYTNTLQTVKTICRIHNRSAKKGGWAILMFVQSYFHPFFNFSPKSIEKCSFIQMRSLRETHLKIHLLPSSYPPILKKSR